MRTEVSIIFFKACWQRIALVVFLLVSSVNGQVLINEFSASNSTQIEDTDFEKYSDWIELYNAGTNAQNIKGYFLTDDFKEPEKWRISSDLTIEAHQFQAVSGRRRDCLVRFQCRIAGLHQLWGANCGCFNGQNC